MTSAHLAIGIVIGILLTLASWSALAYIVRPEKLSLRDYYDVYFGHCRNCRIQE